MKRGMTPKAFEALLVQKGFGQGTKLRKLRVKKGLSQNELSLKSGVSLKSIQQFEQHAEPINRAKLSTICSLCICLDCKIEDVLEDSGMIANYKRVK